MSKTRKILLSLLMCVAVIFVAACKGKDTTPFSHGSWSGKTYTSQFLGIKVETGFDWTVLSDADLAKRSGISNMSESSIQSRFDKGGTVYEMMAIGTDGSSMIITVQDHNKTLALGEKEFFSAGLPLIKTMMEGQGFNASVEKDTVFFLGKNTDCISLALTKDNVTVYETMIPIFKSHYTAMMSFGSLRKPDLYLLINTVSAI